MTPLDPEKSPKVHIPPLNHIGLWIDDLPKCVEHLESKYLFSFNFRKRMELKSLEASEKGLVVLTLLSFTLRVPAGFCLSWSKLQLM